MQSEAFVFIVCGDRHASRLKIALRYLRHFSRKEIWVVRSRTKMGFACDRIIDAEVPVEFDDGQAARLLKASLHRVLPWSHSRYCYLDNDVIAVNRSADEIFGHFSAPVSFAPDHSTLDQFSQCAVNCGCENWGCDHLREAIRQMFEVGIALPQWRQWNGGVFIFERESREFMDFWHAGLLAIFKNPCWKARDQGVLAATVWKFGLQDHPVLPRQFNQIVDALKNAPATARGDYLPKSDESYSLGPSPGLPRPSLLHFINDGVGKRGWRNWDEVERLLR